MQICGMVLFYLKITTFRAPLMFGLFFTVRQGIQSIFLMSRPDGFLWTNPGIPSLTVPYHDTNDFYYSGHVGTCMMYLMEFYCIKNNFFIIYCLVVLVCEWSLLTMLRTHYIIDLLSAVVIAHFCFINAEWMSYIFDVKFMGWDGKKRNHFAHEPCKKCGWCNTYVKGLTSTKERSFLKNLMKLRKEDAKRREADDA